MKILLDQKECLQDYTPPKKLGEDIFCFIERSWCNDYNIEEMPFKAKIVKDNVAIAEFEDYEDWLSQLKCETRARIKRAAKRGLTVTEVNYTFTFALGVSNIYNETSIRQGRYFTHFNMPIMDVANILSLSKNKFIGAYHEGSLVGFIELGIGDCTGQILQILSLQSKRDLLPNNALIAKAVEVCAENGCNWLVYARMGNHPSLDDFKRNNGFKTVEIKRFYVPLTLKGKLYLTLGLHRSIKDSVPKFLKPVGFKVYNFFNRTLNGS